jgi:hypothetical protein
MATAKQNDGRVFVFGSNLAGHHGAGAALFAIKHRGALWGVGCGPQGQCYAIPTKDWDVRTSLPLESVRVHVDDFKRYARFHSKVRFEVTKIGCGFARFTEAQIKPMFADAPSNCDLPKGWRENAYGA